MKNEAKFKFKPKINYKHAEIDTDLYPVLEQASENERKILLDILAEKWSFPRNIEAKEIEKIAYEIQLMGGSSVMNKYRGHGVPYKEIVNDVTKKIGIKDVKDNVELQEQRIIEKMMGEIQSHMSEVGRPEWEKQIATVAQNNSKKIISNRLNKSIVGVLPTVSAAVVKRAAFFAIPVYGQVLGAASLIAGGAIIAAGPAYKVTIPLVMMIGAIRDRIGLENRLKELEI